MRAVLGPQKDEDSHREPAAHVKVVQDLQAAGAWLQILRPQRERVERPGCTIFSLQQNLTHQSHVNLHVA